MTATITPEQFVHAVRELRAAGMPIWAIAPAVGVSPRTLQRRLRGHGLSRPQLSDAARRMLISAVHQRRHEGMSVRQIVTWLTVKGYPRSVGWVSTVLREWTCPGCSETTNVATEQSGGAP